MTELLALVTALLSFGQAQPTALHAHANPACAIVKDPNGGCTPGTSQPRSGGIHVRFTPACTGATEPNGGCVG
jgi:hypothetical protein